MIANVEKRRKANRDRYYWLKEHHVCTKCGSAAAQKDRTLCRACAEKLNAKYYNDPAYRARLNERSRERVRRIRAAQLNKSDQK